MAALRGREDGLTGPLGSLAMSCVATRHDSSRQRARAWQKELDRLGVVVPFAIVHDVGLLFAVPKEELTIAPKADFAALAGHAPGAVDVGAQYLALLRGLAESDAAARAGELRMSDALIAGVLARLLGAIARRAKLTRPYPVALPADASPFLTPHAQLVAMWASRDRTFELASLTALARSSLFVLTLADAVDGETLRLLGALGDTATAIPLGGVDLVNTLESPSARDVVSFSLELLPSVLEAKVRPGATTHASSGYAGIGRRGSLDGLVLTELAWDDDELARRIAEDEVLYYARDQAEEPERRTHLLLIDASASMRGDRATFARGLALATAKKLLVMGEEVSFRFFDARLYDTARVIGHELPTSYVLSFQGERGRNPTRVFSALARELSILRSREKREVVVHLFTHGASDIPRPILRQLRAEARLSAIFIAPRGEVHLDYLDLCDTHWTVTNEDLRREGTRDEAAHRILEETER